MPKNPHIRKKHISETQNPTRISDNNTYPRIKIRQKHNVPSIPNFTLPRANGNRKNLVENPI